MDDVKVITVLGYATDRSKKVTDNMRGILLLPVHCRNQHWNNTCYKPEKSGLINCVAFWRKCQNSDLKSSTCQSLSSKHINTLFADYINLVQGKYTRNVTVPIIK